MPRKSVPPREGTLIFKHAGSAGWWTRTSTIHKYRDKGRSQLIMPGMIQQPYPCYGPTGDMLVQREIAYALQVLEDPAS